MVGSGICDYGTIGVMPFNRVPSNIDIVREGYSSNFYHATEVAYPGYYKVFHSLIRSKIIAPVYQLILR